MRLSSSYVQRFVTVFAIGTILLDPATVLLLGALIDLPLPIGIYQFIFFYKAC